MITVGEATPERRLRTPLGTSIVEAGTYFPYIDGLRGIAICMVLLVHASQKAASISTGGAAKYALSESQRYIDGGARGVQLFFILSAFTLYSSSQRRYDTESRPVVSFYIRRAFRILPMWCLAVAAWAVISNASVAPIIAQVTFLFGFLRADAAYDLVPGGWSLFVEETFYLFLPLLFARVRSVSAVVYLLIGTGLLATIWRTDVAPRLLSYDHNDFFVLFPLAQWFAFAAGIAVCYLMRHPAIGEAWFDKPAVFRALDAAALAMLAGFIGQTENLFLPTAALFTVVIASVSSQSCFGKVTRFRPLRLIGRYCYSIYLIHFLVLYWLQSRIAAGLAALGFDEVPLELRTVVVFAFLGTVCFGLAVVSYNALELTFVRAGRRVVTRVQH